MTNIPLTTDDNKLLHQLNNSLNWYKNNKIAEMNAEFDIGSINTLYLGLYALLETLRAKADKYGIQLAGTVSGSVISEHSTKVTTILPKAPMLKDVNSTFVKIEESLSQFNADLLMEINTSAEKLVSIGYASYGNSESGDSIDALISSLRTEAAALISALDADLAQEVVDEAREEAAAETEEEVAQAKEEAVAEEAVSDEDAQSAMDDVNATWEAAEAAAEEQYTAAQEAAKAAEDAVKAAEDAFYEATAANTAAQEAAKAAEEAAKDAQDAYTAERNAGMAFESAEAAEAWTTAHNNPGTPVTVTDTVEGQDVTITITANPNGTTQVTVQNETTGNTTTRGYGSDYELATAKSNQDTNDAYDAKNAADAAKEAADQAAKDAQEGLSKASDDLNDAQLAADAAQEAAQAAGESYEDNTTTITVGDGNGGTVDVTFTDADADGYGDEE